MAKKTKTTYETALKELQEIVSQLQEEMVSVDDLSAKAKRAATLVSFCQDKLRTTEKELKDLFD